MAGLAALSGSLSGLRHSGEKAISVTFECEQRPAFDGRKKPPSSVIVEVFLLFAMVVRQFFGGLALGF